MERKEVAVGMDGCVYKPAFSCNEEHTYDDKQYISKLMSQKKVEDEIKKYKELGLNKLDTQMNYFISNPELCELNHDDITSYNDIKKKCTETPPRVALNYIDGGIDLFTIIHTIDYIFYKDSFFLDFFDVIFMSFDDILKGVQLLNENNIIHFDIKPDNIVIKNFATNKFNASPLNIYNMTKLNIQKFKLIDFGLSRNISQHPPTGFFGTTGYIPPEMYMIGDIEKNYNDFLKKAKSESPEIIKILKEKNINANYYESLDPILFYKKADVWAIGMTLLQIYNIIMNWCKDNEKKFSIMKSYDTSKILYDDRVKLYNGFLKKQLIDEMLNPNVDERLHIEDVVEGYGVFLDQLNSLNRDNGNEIATKLSEYLKNPPPELLEYLNGSTKTKSIQRRASMGGKRIKRRYATKKKKYRKNKKKNTRKR